MLLLSNSACQNGPGATSGGRLVLRYCHFVLHCENRAGAFGLIGSEIVAKAPRDCYTLLVGNVGLIQKCLRISPA